MLGPWYTDAGSMPKLIVLYLVAFVDTVGAALVVPILPFYATRYGASALTVGLLVSAFSLAQLVTAPAWGRFSDRAGRRPAIIAGLVIGAAAYVLFALSGSVWLLLISRLIQGVGGGTIGVVQAYVADASPGDQRTQAIGWLTTVTSLGWLSGSALGSILVALGGPQAPGLFTAGLSLAAALLAMAYLVEPADHHGPSQAATSVKPRSGRQAIRQVLTRWSEPAPRLIWIYAIGIGAFYGTAAVMPLLAEDRLGFTEKTIGYLVMYFAGLGVVVRAFFLGRMVKWLGEPKLARLGIVALGVGLALAGFGTGYPVLFAGFTLMPIGTAFLFPGVTAMLSRAVARSERGVYLGVQQTFGGVGRVAFPLLAGFIMDRFGHGAPYGVAAALVLATLPLATVLNQPPDEPATPKTA